MRRSRNIRSSHHCLAPTLTGALARGPRLLESNPPTRPSRRGTRVDQQNRTLREIAEIEDKRQRFSRHQIASQPGEDPPDRSPLPISSSLAREPFNSIKPSLWK